MRRVGDHFSLLEPLGNGGMGRIHRGRDERDGRFVAIKFLKRAHEGDAILRERFRREARALAKLDHPGIVRLLDYGEADGELYTVLELIDGASLDALLPLARPEAILDQLLAALEACHAHGVVHRDIKPANVMVAGDRVTLIDFGLARMPSDEPKLTETGVVQGTPQYMAPEQCRGEEVGPEADVYAAGLVIYEVLAGARPFEGKDAATFMAQQLFVEPVPLDRRAGLASPVARAVEWALRKAPAVRPTASALRRALREAFAGGDSEAEAADERQHASTLERRERGLGSTPREVRARGATILVWIDDPTRALEIRTCLGAAGHTTLPWTGDAPPDLGAVDLVVVADVRRLSRARPTVIVDVATPAETTAAIRAGASEMLLRGAPDGDLAPKLQRLLRRALR